MTVFVSYGIKMCVSLYLEINSCRGASGLVSWTTSCYSINQPRYWYRYMCWRKIVIGGKCTNSYIKIFLPQAPSKLLVVFTFKVSALTDRTPKVTELLLVICLKILHDKFLFIRLICSKHLKISNHYDTVNVNVVGREDSFRVWIF